MSEQTTSDSLEQGIDSSTDKAMAAKGMNDAARNGGASAAYAGEAAAERAASAGVSAGAASGAGATAGSAAGPAGTVMGAVTGFFDSLIAKPVIKGIIVIAFVVVMAFSSLPSMFFENAVDVADNTGPAEIYRQFREYAMEKYLEELENRKEEIEDDFKRRKRNGEFDDYDHVSFSYSFDPSEDTFVAELSSASDLIIAMFEVKTDDWRKATFSQFKNAVNSVYFWNNTISVSKDSEEREVTYEDDERFLHIHATYNIYDKGVEVFRSKFDLADDKEYVKSVEMAYNIKIFFGEVDDMPMGGVTGGTSGTYPGGGTHNAIRQAMASLEVPRDFFGGSAAMPLPSGTWVVTSEFGPRNFAPDPIHTGIDFAAASGMTIYSVMDGIILLRLTNESTFGHHIVVYHGGGITSMYAHMSSFGSYQVGDSVRRGDVVGYVGRTGLTCSITI